MIRINLKNNKEAEVNGYYEDVDTLNYSGRFASIEKSNRINYINIIYSYSCRESFHEEYLGKYQETRQFLFSHNGKFNELQKFLQIIEKKLGLSARNQIKLDNVKPKYCLVTISNWWLKYNFRLQFLTILLRAGTKFQRSYRAALFSEKYFERTKKSVNLFLSGYNKVKKDMDIFDQQDEGFWDEKNQDYKDNPDWFEEYAGWVERLEKITLVKFKRIFYK